MIRSLCTAGSLALMMTLTACATSPSKQQNTLASSPKNIFSPVASDSLSERMQADSLFIEGDVYSREGKTKRAIELFEKVAVLDPSSPYVHIRLAAEYFKMNKNAAAIKNAEKAIQKEPTNIEAHLLLGGLHSADKDYERAISQYRKVLELQPRDTEAALYLGSLYTELKDYKKAVLYFQSLLQNPEYKSPHLAHYNLGLMYANQSGEKYQVQAQNQFKKALTLNPGHTDSVMSLARVYLDQRRHSKALSLCLDFQEQRFSSRVANFIAQIYMENGDSTKALEQYELIAENSEPTLEIQMKIALILIEQKSFHLAAVKLKDILEQNKSADGARYYLAAVQEQNGELKEALRNYMLVSAKSEHFSQAVVHGAYLLKGMGKINQALDITTKGLSAKADKPQVYVMHASLLEAKADHRGAASILEEGLSKYSKNVELLFQHALVMEQLGKKTEMMKQMKKLLEIEPDHVQSLSYLAFSMAEMNQYLFEAEKMARRAVELQSTDAYVLDTLGWVLFKQNKFSDAIKILEKAHALQPDVSIIAEHLAEAYAKLAMTEKAKAMYKVAAGLTKDGFKITSLMEKADFIQP